MKNKLFLIVFFLILANCTTIDEVGKVMTNQKIKTNDEFLVEKKDPLIIPPNSSELPEPNTNKNEQTKNQLKKILKEDNSSKTSNSRKSSSTETSILNQIKK